METASDGGGFPRALPLLLLVLPVLPVLPRAAAEQGERIPGTARRVERFASGAVPLCGFPFPVQPSGIRRELVKRNGMGKEGGRGVPLYLQGGREERAGMEGTGGAGRSAGTARLAGLLFAASERLLKLRTWANAPSCRKKRAVLCEKSDLEAGMYFLKEIRAEIFAGSIGRQRVR